MLALFCRDSSALWERVGVRAIANFHPFTIASVSHPINPTVLQRAVAVSAVIPIISIKRRTQHARVVALPVNHFAIAHHVIANDYRAGT